MLTRRMHNLLLMIDGAVREHGVAPSFDEMKDALGLKSKSGIHRLIESLEERGYVRRLANRARAIEVVKLPGRDGAGGVQPARAANSNLVDVPVMGRIAAGTPIEAIQTRTGSVAMSASALGAGEHFALEVRGDSMKDAGILDGDTAIIRKQESASVGDIVVALIDGEEATLKRFRRSGAMVALEAANPAYVARVVDPARVAIQGKLVGLTRVY